MYRAFAILILLATIVSCNGQKKTVANQQDMHNEEKMVLVDQNNFSGADSTETMIIKSAKALKSFYSRVNRTRKPGLPVPEIDFSKNIVVILCSSDENFKGTERLSVVDETNTEIVLGMKKNVENKSDISTSNADGQVSPFFVYKMQLSDKQVSFKAMK